MAFFILFQVKSGMDYLNLLKIAGGSIAIYLFILIAIRIFGKREMSQLSVIDFVFILLIANSVQNAMVLGDNSFVGGLVAASALFLINFVIKLLIRKNATIAKIIIGEPLMLIYDGKIIVENLNKAQVSHDELMVAIREHGVSIIEEVNLAILEVDGNISVCSGNFSAKSIVKRKKGKLLHK